MNTNFIHNETACCAHCGQPVGGLAVPCKTPQAGNKTRYMHRECWLHTYKPKELHGIVSGTRNNTRCAYRVTLHTPEFNKAAHAALLENKGGHWYPIDGGCYVSPQYQNMKWHRKLETIAKTCDSAELAISILDYNGNILDVLLFKWANRDELGRFLSKDAKKRNGFLRAIDKATTERKGYTNYPKA